ncbi:DUF2865 domain-containing protein [uncultured Devosia sp.]|uniref:DUF2865 domain-containing protein n=1 Tax=uncultured Devosia sp. TaxID=211434 RepID=UPI0035CBB052
MWRMLAALVVAMICVGLDASAAYAQSSSCSRLQGMLRQFDRNGDFQNMQSNSGNARGLRQQVQDAESAYVRNGCNADAKAGRTLSPQCQGLGRDVLRLREDYANINQSVETANAVAQQREAILQELARFGCGADQGSSATMNTERQSIFDRIFGTTSEGDFSDGQMIGDEDYWGYGGYSTVRTVCVRISDGYFWPISYSTLQDYLPSDAAQCHAMCPNAAVDLYFYDNPGQDVEQMRNMTGAAYTDLPSAFAYREAIDTTSTCKSAPVGGGSIISMQSPNGEARSVVQVGESSFPLPLRDPRRQMPVAAPAPAPVAAMSTIALLDIPLPRPRPPGPGEAPAAKPVVQNADTELRLVQFGDKVVRVVGPDTPYAQPAGAGT